MNQEQIQKLVTASTQLAKQVARLEAKHLVYSTALEQVLRSSPLKQQIVEAVRTSVAQWLDQTAEAPMPELDEGASEALLRLAEAAELPPLDEDE